MSRAERGERLEAARFPGRRRHQAHRSDRAEPAPIAAITLRSSARRRSQSGHGGPSGSTRLTTISLTRMPARSSAATPSRVSSSDSSSGNVTHDKPRPPRIAQPRRGLARLLRQHRNQPIGRFGTADARELLANQPMLVLQLAEHLGHRRDGFRRGQQPQRVAGRRGVDDDQVVGRRVTERASAGSISRIPISSSTPGIDRLEQRVDVLAIEPGAVLEDLAERPAVFLQPAREGPRRVELDRVERSDESVSGCRSARRRARRRGNARDRWRR